LSGSYATPLQLELVPSRRLAFILAAAHGAGLMLLPFTGLAAGLQLLAGLLLIVSGWYTWRSCTATAAGRGIRRLVWGRDGRVDLLWRDGSTTRTQLQPEACVTPWLVVMQLRDAGRQTYHLPVLPDMLPRSQFRRLRVRLRLEIPRLAGRRA
jgi:toxin CptA